MRADKLLISLGPGERRLALMRGEQVLELFYERGRTPIEGGIFAGRVTAVEKDLNAAFVDIGTDVPGFLGFNDARAGQTDAKSIAQLVKAGDKVLVQADRAQLAGKGPRLTRRITLPGRFGVLSPRGDGFKFPRFIGRQARKSLGFLEDDLLPGEGFSFHPAAVDAPLDVIGSDLEQLRERWAAIEDAFKGGSAPACLAPAPDALDRALALVGYGADIICESLTGETTGAEGLDTAMAWRKDEPLFDAFGVEDAIATALDAVQVLPSGGRLIYSETPALTAIDVDTGRAGAATSHKLVRQTNLEAASALARGLRLRRLAGQVVVDFLPMKGKKDRQDVLARLKQALEPDPVETHVLGFSALGLVEMTRRRTGPSLAEMLTAPVSRAPSTDSQALAVLRGLARARGVALTVTAPEAVIALLEGRLKGELEGVEARLGLKVALEARGPGPVDYEIKSG